MMGQKEKKRPIGRFLYRFEQSIGPFTAHTEGIADYSNLAAAFKGPHPERGLEATHLIH